ncbi:MAG: hypothetical protein ACYTGZ_05730 [Planctomycetota bacterium]
MQQSERQRTDPLIPILASAVALVCLGAILLVFYPRVRSLVAEGRGAVVRSVPPEGGRVPLWVCRSEKGVAILIEPRVLTGTTTDAALDALLGGGPNHYLRLSIYNFGRADSYRLSVPDSGFDSPEGGARLIPCAALLPETMDAAGRTLLLGLGATQSLEVPTGRRGQILLVVSADVAGRTAFVSGGLRFERREVPRLALAKFRQRPDLRDFLDF